MTTIAKSKTTLTATQWLGTPEYNYGGEWMSFALIRGDLYRVVCTAVSSDGDSFELQKIEGNSVSSTSSVQMDRHGSVLSCSCKGYQFRHTCKHASELPALIDEAKEVSF